MCRAPHYKLHINIGELRAAVRVERLLGEQAPSSRLLLGADSQVALGTLIKGRATSRALNQELIRSIPWMLGLDVYLECLYFHTKLNRGDDPTRGRDIRPPTRCWPEWIAEIEAGNSRVLIGGLPNTVLMTLQSQDCHRFLSCLEKMMAWGRWGQDQVPEKMVNFEVQEFLRIRLTLSILLLEAHVSLTAAVQRLECWGKQMGPVKRLLLNSQALTVDLDPSEGDF